MKIIVDKQEFTSREKALQFFLNGMVACDGSESDRMAFAYISILDGCTDIDTYREKAI